MGFVFILYDFENPHLTKGLDDQAYWEVLNKVSGKCLTVFSLHTKRLNKVLLQYRIKSNDQIEQEAINDIANNPMARE